MSSPLAPRFWPVHLLALAAAALAGWLGVWQWQAWEAHREAAARDLTAVDPIPLAEALGPDDPFPGDMVGQPVVVDGTWVPGGTVYVTGRLDDGRDGVWAVTPLAVDGADGSALLVVRGWAPSVDDAPAPPTGAAELVAGLQPPDGTGEVDTDPTDDLLPQLRIADAIQHVDQDLYGAYGIVADQATPGAWPVGDRAVNPGTQGLSPVAPPRQPDVGSFTSLRNLLYALEWWVFGGFAVFLWWRYLRDQRDLPDLEPEPEQDADRDPDRDPRAEPAPSERLG
ncbi:SURF1 family protein [Nocardioides sp.]|uniref:SURF1 family protein n=1 Tax=Nocardioides sp. TaxID=35761 RepID=UPI0035271052